MIMDIMLCLKLFYTWFLLLWLNSPFLLHKGCLEGSLSSLDVQVLIHSMWCSPGSDQCSVLCLLSLSAGRFHLWSEAGVLEKG